MLLLNAQNVKKSYGDKVILQFEKLAIYQGEKIGLVGYNGAGKSTLLQILAGNVEPEQGAIERQCEIAYYKQLDTSYVMNHDDEKEDYDIGMRGQGQVPAPVPEMGSESKLHRKLLNVDERYQQSVVSGGENTRLRLADTFAKVKHILLADEPTTNLDMKGVELVKRRLMEVETLLIVSHDRELLDALCTRIIEVREGNLFFYNGNYSDYEEVRQRNMERQLLEYESYIGEKERLQNIFKAKMEKAKEVGRMPAKLSPKECRLRNFLSSRPSDAKERRMQEAAKAVKSRIDQLEVKQKPKEIPMIRINFLLTNPPENRFVMEGSNVSFSYGRRVIFKEASFRFQNGKHIAIIGDNGVGKTTLLNLITQNELGIRIVPKARLAYFRQDYSDLDLSATVIENVRKDSIQKEEVDRSVLARLLFSSDMLLKRAEVLSGGERIKLALAKLFVSNANVLILDEPTNFLDMPSI
ncbi:MAG TPA: ATP-binding cassette domain-containing protein, partial [Lachnospiraceae bacterium]|nr:ATP-binding cassette domain-containing protein [Lachnospiraceae bacterium]